MPGRRFGTNEKYQRARTNLRAMVAFGALAILLAAILAAVAAPVAATKKEEGLQTSVPAAILLDADSDSILYDKNGDELVAPASLAKLMTIEFLFNEIKEGRVKPDDEYIISENAWRKGGAPSHGSTMFAPIHSRVKVSDLIQGIIVDSANDACIAVAEALAGNEGSFGQVLTRRAREIGLGRSTFTNSTGYSDPDLRVTAREMAELARHIIRDYPDFYPYFSQRDFAWNNIHQQNRNPLLGMGIGADGLKTGETSEAGFNLVGSAIQDNFRLIVVVTGAKTDKERADEAKKLLDFGFHDFQARVLFAEGQTVGDAKVFGGDRSYVPLVASGIVRLMVPRNNSQRLLARIVYTGPIPAPIARGQPIGKLKVWRGENLALEIPLQAADDVGPGSMPQRAMDGATELMIGLLRAGVNKL
ncbi:MAG TPA: D-alanyl-D-alanine carboxypeptidase family protein [Xanthobacteraceae bacterium]|jgi:D-alanyl-D-alanine carboxypeptidase (penicillin-binding protein 5/6)|nr:D-alanyl-D-alanine carboxypeptidase family protein [Xanthobacteraceae bacterium]